jgi:hypothetical protein
MTFVYAHDYSVSYTAPNLRNLQLLNGFTCRILSKETNKTGNTCNVTLRLVRNYCCRGKAKSITYLCVCARMRIRACAQAHGRAYACSLAYPACNSYAPYCDVTCGSSGSTMFFAIIS